MDLSSALHFRGKSEARRHSAIAFQENFVVSFGYRLQN
jgi:hypothetical protein